VATKVWWWVRSSPTASQAISAMLLAIGSLARTRSGQEARLRERAERYGFSLVASTEVLYHTPARRPVQDVLTAIRNGLPAQHGLRSPHAFASLSCTLGAGRGG